MKICIYGAGAVGGLMAAWLARAGHEVSVIARGAHLDAIRKDKARFPLVAAQPAQAASCGESRMCVDKLSSVGRKECVNRYTRDFLSATTVTWGDSSNDECASGEPQGSRAFAPAQSFFRQAR